MKKRVYRVLACVFSLVLLSGLMSCRDSSSSTHTIDKVYVTYVTSPLNVPSVIEKEQGQFRKAFSELGLEFGYSDLDSGADQTAALASGSIHFLNAVGGSSVLLAAANDADIIILSMYSRAPKAFCMFSNDETIDSPFALRGLKVAGPKGTNLHELLAAYLNTGAMTIEDVDFISMDIPSAVAALENGSVDVALVGGKSAYDLEKAGKHKITDGEGLISATICTATSRRFADEEPEIVEAFLKAQQEVVDYMNAETDKALDLTAETLDMDRAAVEEMFGLYDFNTEVTEEDIAEMEKTEHFLHESGLTEKFVDVPKLIYQGSAAEKE